MRRREIITLIGGAAVGWLHRAVAQQTDRMRRIGVLLPYAQNDLEAKSHLSAFTQQLERLGWLEGHNIRIDARFAAGNADQYAVLATELAALQPDVQSRHPRPPRYSTRRGRFR
jgi:putative tryptophan/tyrosine transport system substrate-binding protein